MSPSRLFSAPKLAAALLFCLILIAASPPIQNGAALPGLTHEVKTAPLGKAHLPGDLAFLERSGANSVRFLTGLGYGPFREGQSPDTGVCPSEGDIRADMPILVSLTASIETFGVTCGAGPSAFENICRIANDFGLRCMPTAWLGPDAQQRERELSKLVEVARGSPNIDSVVVGNEALLFNYLTVVTLTQYIRWVKQQLPDMQVTTAEPPHIWIQYANVLTREVDLINVVVHPYWDGVSIDQAASHAIARYSEVRQRAGGKPVVVAETGWPDAGDIWGAAVPSLANQRRFLAEFACLANARGIQYYYFEPFDEPWKVREPRGVGPHWGIYTKDRTSKHPGLPEWRCAAGTLRPLEASLYMDGQYYLEDVGRVTALVWPGDSGRDLRPYLGQRVALGGPYRWSVVNPSIPVITVYGLVPLGVAALPKATGPLGPSVGGKVSPRGLSLTARAPQLSWFPQRSL